MIINLITADRNPSKQSLFVVRDDLYPLFYGGNKARKMAYIIKDMEQGRFDALVTTGGIQSNHCRVAALACAEKGWKCRLVLHGSRKQFYAEKGNALLMRRSGALVDIVEEQEIAPAMDRSMQELETEGRRPYYLHGGGHNLYGVLAYKEAVLEFQKAWLPEHPPDHIFLASGTGSTQAGLLAGCRSQGWSGTRVWGISVARTGERGIASILECIGFLGESPDTYRKDIYFEDGYTFGGYGCHNRELEGFTERMARESGQVLDNTYTGKAFYGMLDLISRKKLKGTKVFWHTGGLLNLMD